MIIHQVKLAIQIELTSPNTSTGRPTFFLEAQVDELVKFVSDLLENRKFSYLEVLKYFAE